MSSSTAIKAWNFCSAAGHQQNVRGCSRHGLCVCAALLPIIIYVSALDRGVVSVGVMRWGVVGLGFRYFND